MKYLNVNGDDFGASRGVTRGIIEAHRDGILTSTSMMVDTPYAEQAARESADWPVLAIGLHVAFTNEAEQAVINLDDAETCRRDLQRQYDRFISLMDRPPTHLDSHHNIH